jgi:CO dehydrogenase/acetyl-CoA synthase beta subunit
MAIQFAFTGDDESEVIEALKAFLEARGFTVAEAEAEEATEEESTEEETTEEEVEVEVEEEPAEEDPMQELRDKLVEKIRAMSKKASDIAKIKDAFKKLKIAKFDDEVKDAKLAPLAKMLGVK